MTKARTLADFISDGSPLADGTISVSEVSGAAPLANPTFTGTASGTFSGPLTGNVTGNVTGNITGNVTGNVTGDVAGEVDLSALAATISDTAVDVFVYDTSKDSDGGEWRKRTQGTSWYNETLNTATRGSRKEFPAVAVIVAEANDVTIYDGDDPDLSMWMVFTGSGGPRAVRQGISSVSAFNGVFLNGRSGSERALGYVSFIHDDFYQISNGGLTRFNQTGLVNRNTDGSGYTVTDSSMAIVNNTINDVAMTVLPNAPIDAATGLPVPTIAVGTDGGVSVIRDDGTVVDITSTGPDGSKANRVSFSVTNQLVVGTHTNYDVRYDEIGILDNIPSADRSSYQWGWDRAYNYSWNNDRVPSLGYANSQYDYQYNALATSKGTLAVDHPNGLTLVDDSNPVRTNNMVHYVTPDYATGWMNGDIKLATLSDTDDTDVTGNGELVTNSTFDTDITGWSVTNPSNSTITVSGGIVTIDQTANPISSMYQVVSVTAGATYMIEARAKSVGGNYPHYIRVGNSINGSDFYSSTSTSSSFTTHTGTFTPTGNTIYVSIGTGSGYNDIGYFDYVSVVAAEEDRSVNGNGLQVFSTVYKNPVATGADLVGYSNFTNSTSYLQQPHLAANEIGSGDACLMIWFKTSASGVSEMLISFEGEAYDTAFNIRKETGNHITGWATGNGFSTNIAINSSADYNDNVWHHAAWVKQGTTYSLYIDGKLDGTGTYSTALNYSSNDEKITIGRRTRLQGDPFYGQLALARFSHTAPSPEQIKKIYEDEKVLFQENAQATLYGSSDAVTALAYDDSTELLHVGTSAGRSVFQGLRRVDNTTTAVGAAISASNGLVADE
jgi:hypothetical protein